MRRALLLGLVGLVALFGYIGIIYSNIAGKLSPISSDWFGSYEEIGGERGCYFNYYSIDDPKALITYLTEQGYANTSGKSGPTVLKKRSRRWPLTIDAAVLVKDRANEETINKRQYPEYHKKYMVIQAVGYVNEM